MEDFESLSRDELLTLVRMYARNWLAHDGSWFLAAEETLGLDAAIDLDTKSWDRFAVAEAKRIMRDFGIPPGSGLKGLERALGLRLYAAINDQEIEWRGENTMKFRMKECRVQKTRTDKQLAPFPCKSVGIVEFTRFASTIDPRICTRCVSCPPDPVVDAYCTWEFTLEQGETEGNRQ